MFEHLEARRLLAGSPTPTAGNIQGTLVVTGGTKVDNVNVNEDGAGIINVYYTDSAGGIHPIYTGPAAATPNGVTVDTLGKNDKIFVSVDSIEFFVRAAAGDDQVVIGGTAVGNVDGSTGKDTITVFNGNGVRINGGDGDDKIFLTEAAGSSEVNGGKGNDTITVDNANNTLVNGNDGADKIIINSSSAAPGDAAAVIDAGAGNDYIALVAGDNYVNGGLGFDTLELHTSNGASTLFGQVSIENVIIA